MVEPVDSDFGSVFFVGRESFRMQIAGTPGPVVDEPAVPMLLPHQPTMRIVDRRQRNERRLSDERRRSPALEAAADWTPGPMPSLSKRALIGLCLITFSSGILVATAIYRLRPGASTSAVAAEPAPVEPITPAVATSAPSVVVIQQLPQAEPEQVLAAREPAAPEPAVAVAPEAAKPAPAAKFAPAVRARPAPAVRPKRPTQATAARVAAPKATEPDLFAPPAPASKKWVDPFAE